MITKVNYDEELAKLQSLKKPEKISTKAYYKDISDVLEVFNRFIDDAAWESVVVCGMDLIESGAMYYAEASKHDLCASMAVATHLASPEIPIEAAYNYCLSKAFNFVASN